MKDDIRKKAEKCAILAQPTPDNERNEKIAEYLHKLAEIH